MELRGHLNLLLLGTLAAVDPAHGYAVIAALRERTGNAFDLPEGNGLPGATPAGTGRAGHQRLEYRGVQTAPGLPADQSWTRHA
ncbi:MAG TPA: hypothetical protein VGP04_21550 [Pseudonocardiaceae bacterium]|jgi:hypothetical protein|nr:hypothetical protein [Pseudonocardiaceae bacterium]